jgi:hypothetical protein
MPRKPWVPLPSEAHRFNEVYLDETSTKHRYLVIGGIICPVSFVDQFAADIVTARGIDLPIVTKDGAPSEIKWNKVSNAKLDAYKRVVLTFFQFANKIPLAVGRLDFHSAVVDTTIKGGELNEIGFNKEVRTLASKFTRVYPQALLHIYLDERTTRHKLWKEQQHLNHSIHLHRPKKDWPIRRLMFQRSHEVQGIQVADILLGALAYRLNGHYDLPDASPAKIELSNYVMKLARVVDPFRDTKHLARYTIWHRDKPHLKPMLKASRSPTPLRVPPARGGSST